MIENASVWRGSPVSKSSSICQTKKNLTLRQATKEDDQPGIKSICYKQTSRRIWHDCWYHSSINWRKGSTNFASLVNQPKKITNRAPLYQFVIIKLQEESDTVVPLVNQLKKRINQAFRLIFIAKVEEESDVKNIWKKSIKYENIKIIFLSAFLFPLPFWIENLEITA